MAFLYVNSRGVKWTRHSYSAGLDFEQSPKKYYLRRILGWKERDVKASLIFGRAIETAIQHHHEHNGEGAVDRFLKEWAAHHANNELKFTRVEKDWSSLRRTGIEMVKLYIIRQPSLPIPIGGSVVFQREYAKEVFPGDPTYGGIEDVGKLDIVAYVDPNHPKLPKLIWKPEYGFLRPIIIDIKTSGVDFPEEYGIAAYDAQLRRYSWQSNIRDVALLWFTKKAHKLQKGFSVTLLEDAGTFKAGDEAVIAQVEGEDVVLVANDFLVEEMERVQGVKKDKNGVLKPDQTNEGRARRDAWLKQFGAVVPSEVVTKQRLQFNAGYVSVESAEEAGEAAGQQIINIVNAWHLKRYPSTWGIRFPRNDQNDPYFRAFVLGGGDETFRKQNFIKADEEVLDDLFAEEENEV